jgi:hypothetical protein
MDQSLILEPPVVRRTYGPIKILQNGRFNERYTAAAVVATQTSIYDI